MLSKLRTRIYQTLLTQPSISLDELRTSLAQQGLPLSKLMLIAIASDFLSTLRFLRNQGMLSERPQFSGPTSAKLSRCPPGIQTSLLPAEYDPPIRKPKPVRFPPKKRFRPWHFPG
jgi:hypothetical protein